MGKQLLLFLQLDGKNIKRKWRSLPLLFLFPVLFTLLSAILIAFLIHPQEKNRITVGLIDHDDTPETEGIVRLFAQSEEMNSLFRIKEMSESEAEQLMEQGEISAYIILPKDFTANLYEGKSAVLPVIGNPNKQMESHLIYEIVESIARHIRSSQANILTIHHFASELGKNEEKLQDLLFQQFTDFVFYTLSSGQVIHEKTANNEATSSPMNYFSIGGLFIIYTSWLWLVYLYLYREIDEPLVQRMRLYGVTKLSFLLSRMIWSLFIAISWTGILFIPLHLLLDFELGMIDFLKIFVIYFLHGLLFLCCICIIEIVFSQEKVQLFLQLITFVVISLFSGAIIPAIYFPIWLQELASYSFSYEAFYWVREIVFYGRKFVSFLCLLCMTIGGNIILFGISSWKERLQS
ncbi:hypothetical protein GCM10010978_10330 [Compostibacillus humi]|uniref:ABC-2 type transporter transmembrane domain-containing protein n=1 Tax=Compostibacillus humi TaxID=1245525 RepID=A0A8J2ZR92_9BACI|nr:ABC transporter permease [Compostibacillus humi]GGH72945.1 hypothetical protein GCM10010978_10330 [Compostibacillus humi]